MSLKYLEGKHTIFTTESAAHLLPPQSLAQETISNLEKAIAEAKKQCDEASAGECAAAWDTVEELSAAIAHKKASVRPRPDRLPHALHSMLGHLTVLAACKWKPPSVFLQIDLYSLVMFCAAKCWELLQAVKESVYSSHVPIVCSAHSVLVAML